MVALAYYYFADQFVNIDGKAITMILLPPKKGTCPVCAIKHGPDEPHNRQSLYYQFRFYGLHGRWPTWADAIAHCSDKIKRLWEEELRICDEWSQPDIAEPIAEPPEQSEPQIVGSLNTYGFGPES